MREGRRGRVRRSRAFEPSDTLVFRVLASFGLSDIAIRLHIERVFADAVGRSVAAHLWPVNFSRGKLTLATATSTWQQQMHFLRNALRDKLNARLHRPYITEIGLVVRSRRPPSLPSFAEAAAPKPAPEPPAPSPGEVRTAAACAQAIDDHELRELFARTMAKQLAKQTKRN